mmetsp:Transcript_26957/g.23801  ORF Transcript_26957/g.23801 Transcript_26957/m.23801 type:complete len:156 (+) Transcript_26957:289-756(+)
MLEQSQIEKRKLSIPYKESRYTNKLNSGFKNKASGKIEPIQKVEVFLSSNDNTGYCNENIFESKNSITEAMKPLTIKPKDHASLFKSKPVFIREKSEKEKIKKQGLAQIRSKFPTQPKSQRMVFTSQEKARNALGSRGKKVKPKKLEKYLRPSGL